MIDDKPPAVPLTRRAVCAGALALGAMPLHGARPKVEHFAFSYFRNADNGAAGMRLAISADGRRFAPVRGGAPVIVPTVGENRLMRDPCIVADPRTGLFHMVWTTSWSGVTIGHASSRDLVSWGAQQAIPVMAAFPGTRNSWAPEVFFDTARGRFVIFWASTVDGAFIETLNPNGKPRNHRIYYTTTRDFGTFSATKLMYQPGFNVIDATLVRDGDALRLFVKDETEDPVRKVIQMCEARTPLGPYGPLSAPITPAWSEGPTAYRAGDELIVLYDRYREHRYGAVATRDRKTWRDITAEISVPDGASHGTVIPIDAGVYRALAGLG